MRRTPVAFAATCARRSPAVSCFERIWARSSVNTSSTIAPASTILTGGMMTPSWNTSRNAPIEAGAPPPTSTWCARFATYPSRSPSTKTGDTSVTSFRWTPLGYGSFVTITSPGPRFPGP